MRLDSWLNKKYYDYIYIEKIDGERVYLDEGESLLISVDCVMLQDLEGKKCLFPTIQVSSIKYKLKSYRWTLLRMDGIGGVDTKDFSINLDIIKESAND